MWQVMLVRFLLLLPLLVFFFVFLVLNHLRICLAAVILLRDFSVLYAFFG